MTHPPRACGWCGKIEYNLVCEAPEEKELTKMGNEMIKEHMKNIIWKQQT
jgi:hypothetical protein